MLSAAQTSAVPAVDTGQTQPPLDETNSLPHWNLLERIFFRFAFAYFVLYMLPRSELDSIVDLIPIPFLSKLLSERYSAMWNVIIRWVGVHLFLLQSHDVANMTPTGDNVLEYIYNLCIIVLALLTTLVWSALDRRRQNYRNLHGWLRLVVRFFLACTLFGYGFVKVFPLQMKPTQFGRMMTPYGEFFPQSVLWAFMGVSQKYTIFCGSVEVLGGLLLLVRRTETLGAIVSVAAMLNVVMLNLFYEVNVKLLSINLLLMAIFLLAPDLRPLMNILVFRRAIGLADLPAPQFRRRWIRIGAATVWVLLISKVLYGNISHGWFYYKQAYITPQRSPLYGIYDVKSFSRNGRELPPLMTDSTRWRKVAMDGPWSGKGQGYLQVRMMDDLHRLYFRIENDDHNVILIHRDGAGHMARDVFTYSLPDANDVLLNGKIGSDALSILLHRIDAVSQFPLAHPRFHWIQR